MGNGKAPSKTEYTTIRISKSSAEKLRNKKRIGESYEESLKRRGAL